MHIASICNNARLLREDGKYKIVGDPTEAALVVLAEKAGLKKEMIEERKIDDLPFNPEFRYRASLVKNETKEVYVIGAPETIIDRCLYTLERKLTKKTKKEIITQIGYN